MPARADADGAVYKYVSPPLLKLDGELSEYADGIDTVNVPP
jgi:hypothetical protein